MNKEFLNAFHNSFASDAYLYLGSFYSDDSTTFRVYAPNAKEVSVVGEFNSWTAGINKMTNNNGIWECTIKNIKVFDNYKYAIKTKKDLIIYKQDPYAHHSETDLGSASKVYPMGGYEWDDCNWMNERNNKNIYCSPVNIYECHLGSWIKNNGNSLNYKAIAKKLCKYLLDMNYNYVELLPIMEHPLLASWGYQVTGFFSVTSRYGVPNDFKYFVNYMHKHNIGVILDWVPAHFCKNDYALIEYDGQYLYEDPAPTRMENKGWGTRIFNYSKPEVKSFLISSACYYLDEFHVDGLRVDAVASMLYLDYDRKEWIPNIYGGNYNLEAISFIQDLNVTLFNKFGNIFMIAEESTAFPNVTKPVYLGGLGFNFKWNMGWMNDTLNYIQNDPYFRGDHHNQMTFAMSYSFSENFVLPISHDEVVHGKKSLIDKMPGEYNDKFSNLKTYLGYMMTHVGKKLLFMGQEFAQFIEWNEANELDWCLLKYPKHNEFKEYVKDLNRIYLKNKALYEIEDSWDGFNWIKADNYSTSTYVYKRIDRSGKELVIILNFSGLAFDNFEIESDLLKGKYKVLLNSDSYIYGGMNKYNYDNLEIKVKKNKLNIPINKLSMLILKK